MIFSPRSLLRAAIVCASAILLILPVQSHAAQTTPTALASSTATPARSVTATPTTTRTVQTTATPTRTPSANASATVTASATISATPPITATATVTRTVAPTPTPAPTAWYDILKHNASLWALDIDDNGDGWIAAGNGTSTSGATRMVRLSDGHLSDTNSVLLNTTLVEVALSADGKTGWALGNGTQQNPRAVLLHLQYGEWTELKDPALINSVKSLSDMVLDPEALNGWAIGLGDIDDPSSNVILRLENGKWSIAQTDVPPGVGLVHLAADDRLNHVWAAGFDENDDAALLTLQNNRWVAVSKPIGHYVIFDIGVDKNGDGWAGLDTNDEPADSPSPSGFVRFKADGTWKQVDSPALDLSQEIYFSRLELDPDGNGWAFGNRLGVGSGSPPLVILALRGEKIVGYQYPNGEDDLAGDPNQQPLYGQATDLAFGPQGSAWAITFEGSVMRFGALPKDGAYPAVASRLEGDELCFKETGMCLHGEFLRYWRANGGLMRFGLPITPELEERLENGKVYLTQYTERARFELHPETQDPNYLVLLGLLGNKLAADRQNEAPFQPAKNAGGAYFAETGHNLSGPIGDYWQKNGGLPVYGYPISEPFEEKSPTDGKVYLVQYFERNRLEYHPESTDPNFKIQLGLLGVQQYQQVYGRNP